MKWGPRKAVGDFGRGRSWPEMGVREPYRKEYRSMRDAQGVKEHD